MRRAALAWASVVVVSACVSNRKDALQQFAHNQCQIATDSVVMDAAVRQFIADASPTPQRFLYIFGTDSTPPEPVVDALNDKGPTYMYPATDRGQQQSVRNKLSSIGEYASLLIAYHGFQRVDGTHGLMKLSGVYVGGKADAQTLPRRDVRVECDSAGWHSPASVHPVADAGR